MTKIPKLITGAEPQFYRGNNVGCLVTHGFMASPNEIEWAGKHLAKQGYTVYVPRLTGHGIDPTHMRRMRWQDWYAQVLDGYHILRQQCDTIIAVGHSMGGLLSLLLAVDNPVDALAVCASPVTLSESRLSVKYSRFLNLIMPYTNHPGDPVLNTAIIAEQKKRGEAIIGRVNYQKWSTRAVHEFYLLEKVVQANIASVTVPLLLLYAEQDTTGTPEQAEQIASAVRSKHIETHYLKEGAHIIFQDKGRDEAFTVLADFVGRMINIEE